MSLCIATFTHYTGLYGANRSMLALIDGSGNRNISFFVLTPGRGAITDELEKRGVPHYVVPFNYWMSKEKSIRGTLSRLKTNITALPAIIYKLKEYGINLIHTNSLVTPIGALCAEILRCPHVWHIREFGDLDYDLSFDWGRSISQLLMSNANARVAVSHAVGNHVCGAMGLPYRVVYNGVLSQEDARQLATQITPPKRSSTPFTFAMVGLLHRAKGQRQAIRALHRLKEDGNTVRLLIAGGGGEMQELKSLTQSLKIDKEVQFLGFVSDPFRIYREADAVLMCSPNEAMGRVTAEAMMSKRPVIGYDSQGTKELICDGRNGLLYNGTVENLASKMTALVNSPEMTNRLGRQAFREAEMTYTNEEYARRMQVIFDEVALGS